MAAAKGKQWRIPPGFEQAFVEFQTIPNVGKATAEDLVRLRVRGIQPLAKRDAMTMYEQISKMDGVRHDPCVIDVFMAAVEYARTGACRPWWEYTPERKAMLAASTGGATPSRPERSAGRRRATKRSGPRSRR
jgi:hypothetical protein